MTPKILIVEDDDASVLATGELLTRAGYAVVRAADGREGLRLLFAERPDLLLLDLLIPALDGWRVLARTRDMSDLPVLVLSGLDTVAHRVKALRAGADDYLPKPYDGDELLARVEALLRRSGQQQWAGERAGEYLRFVPERRSVLWYGAEAPLSDIEYGLLQFLVRNRGQVVTTAQLLTRVWKDASGLGGDRVKFAVLRLRRKLRRIAGPGGRDPIAAVRGMGYRFVTAEESAEQSRRQNGPPAPGTKDPGTKS
ncbi:response regulator transcription factor [Streptomyces sp. NPDC098077]|uniref:response regulator transcription factor n=1 Tax=Streptomyces sp. NPDC098077 TaxID=3366093 RepID=UPI00381EA7C3